MGAPEGRIEKLRETDGAAAERVSVLVVDLEGNVDDRDDVIGTNSQVGIRRDRRGKSHVVAAIRGVDGVEARLECQFLSRRRAGAIEVLDGTARFLFSGRTLRGGNLPVRETRLHPRPPPDFGSHAWSALSRYVIQANRRGSFRQVERRPLSVDSNFARLCSSRGEGRRGGDRAARTLGGTDVR